MPIMQIPLNHANGDNSPDGYRLVREGELIDRNDYYLAYDDVWRHLSNVSSDTVGRTYDRGIWVPFMRKIGVKTCR